MAEKKEVVERKFSIDHYLKDSKLSDPLKKMMKGLYRGQTKTMKDWKSEDDKVNKGRC